MKTKKQCIIVISAALMAAACAAPGEKTSLIFAQADIFGVSIGTSAASQTPEFTLGYKGANIAIIPIVGIGADGVPVVFDAWDASVCPAPGSMLPENYGCSRDTMSVLGQFDAAVKKDSGPQQVVLGKFFATGFAARKLADGFAKKLGK